MRATFQLDLNMEINLKIFPAISNNPTHILLIAIKKKMQWKKCVQ